MITMIHEHKSKHKWVFIQVHKSRSLHFEFCFYDFYQGADGFLSEAKERIELASLLTAAVRPLIACLLISIFVSSILSFLSSTFIRSLCLLSSLSSDARSASDRMEALLEIAELSS